MDFRKLTDNDLADFAANVTALLGGSELAAINTTVRTGLVAAIGTLPVDLETQVAAASTAEGTRKAAVSIKNGTREQILPIMSQVRNALLAGRAPKEQYDLCGFDYRDTPVGTYQPVNPTELSAVGFSNGVNTIKFRGNNTPGSVVYEIWRRHGDTAPWTLHTTTTKQSFSDTPVTPGQYYEYKVRATASKAASNFSNPAVVYGA